MMIIIVMLPAPAFPTPLRPPFHPPPIGLPSPEEIARQVAPLIAVWVLNSLPFDDPTKALPPRASGPPAPPGNPGPWPMGLLASPGPLAQWPLAPWPLAPGLSAFPGYCTSYGRGQAMRWVARSILQAFPTVPLACAPSYVLYIVI